MFKDWTFKDTKDTFIILLYIFALLFFVSGFYYYYESTEIAMLENIRYCPRCGFDLTEGK